MPAYLLGTASSISLFSPSPLGTHMLAGTCLCICIWGLDPVNSPVHPWIPSQTKVEVPLFLQAQRGTVQRATIGTMPTLFAAISECKGEKEHFAQGAQTSFDGWFNPTGMAKNLEMLG